MFAHRLRSIGSSLLVPAGITLLLFALLEGGGRVAGRVRTGAWPVTQQERESRFARELAKAYRLHPFLSVAGRPGAEIHLPGYEARFNSLGQRGAEPEQPKPAGRFRVVCEGGSTTIDVLAANDAATWPALLAGFLGPDADVVNGGFQGWTSVESLVALALRDVDLSPDLVVVYSGVNDLQPAGHVPFARDYSIGHGEILPRALGAVPRPLPLVARSVFLEWLRGRLGLAVRRGDARSWAPVWDPKGGGRRDAPPGEAVEVFSRNLKSTAAVARAFGARTLFVAQTVRVRPGSRDQDLAYLESWAPGLTGAGFLEGVKRFNEAARALAASGEALFVDPFAEGAFSDEDFGDPVHFGPSGSRKFARRLAEEIARIRAEAPPPAAIIR